MFKNSQRKIEDSVLGCVRDYIEKSDKLYRVESIEEIRKGKNYFCRDGGVYSVKLKNNIGQSEILLAKKHTNVVRRILLFYHPIKRRFGIPLRKESLPPRPLGQMYEDRMKAREKQVDILPYLYYDEHKRISIRKMASGVAGVKEAFSEDPQKTNKLIYRAGFNIGRLHRGGFAFGDLKPDHFVFDFNNGKINLIDCEKLRKVNNYNKFAKELGRKFRSYFILAIPNEYIDSLWKGFVTGYLDGGGSKAKKIISEIKPPTHYCLACRMLLTVYRKIDLFVGKISFGHLKL